jgi:hypothetical protein
MDNLKTGAERDLDEINDSRRICQKHVAYLAGMAKRGNIVALRAMHTLAIELVDILNEAPEAEKRQVLAAQSIVWPVRLTASPQENKAILTQFRKLKVGSKSPTSLDLHVALKASDNPVRSVALCLHLVIGLARTIAKLQRDKSVLRASLDPNTIEALEQCKTLGEIRNNKKRALGELENCVHLLGTSMGAPRTSLSPAEIEALLSAASVLPATFLLNSHWNIARGLLEGLSDGKLEKCLPIANLGKGRARRAADGTRSQRGHIRNGIREHVRRSFVAIGTKVP